MKSSFIREYIQLKIEMLPHLPQPVASISNLPARAFRTRPSGGRAARPREGGARAAGNDGGTPAVRLDATQLCLAADGGQGRRGAPRRHADGRHAAARLPHHQPLPQAPSGGYWLTRSAMSCACRAAGLNKLGHVALDGTKLAADASKQGDALRPDPAGWARACRRGRGLTGTRRALGLGRSRRAGPEARGDGPPAFGCA